MVGRIVAGAVSKAAAGSLVPERDKYGISLAISAAMGSTVGMIGAALMPSTISGKVNCKKCGTEYYDDMICHNCSKQRARRLGYE